LAQNNIRKVTEQATEACVWHVNRSRWNSSLPIGQFLYVVEKKKL